MLDDIEVLDQPDDNFWMTRAYLIPDTPFADVVPGQQGVKTVPINRMLPRSFLRIWQIRQPSKWGRSPRCEASLSEGIPELPESCFPPIPEPLAGSSIRAGPRKYSFRTWKISFRPAARGRQILMVKAVNLSGATQPDHPNWNGAGFMRNVIESVAVQAV